MEDAKLFFIGDYGTGKTSYLMTATTDAFPGEYLPANGEYSMNIMVDGRGEVVWECPQRMLDPRACRFFSVSLWDSAEQEEYAERRCLSYPYADVFLVCFDTGNRTSFDNIEKKWLPELDHHVPETPKVLVGNKMDLRSEMNAQDVVQYEEAKDLADKHNMLYIENSALQQTGVRDVITNALKIVLARRNSREKELKNKQGGVVSYFKNLWRKSGSKDTKPQ